MNIIEKFSKKLLLCVLFLLCYTETSTAASLAYQLMKKFDISNIKTSFIEKAQKNKNLLFLLGGGALLSFIAWKIKTKKMITQRQVQVEQPPIKQVPVWSEPKIYNKEIAKYYQERVKAFETILKKTQFSEEEVNQIFAQASENHGRCMQYKEGRIHGIIPSEIANPIRLLLNAFEIPENSLEFLTASLENFPDIPRVYLLKSEDRYQIVMDANVIKFVIDQNHPNDTLKYYFKFLSDFVDCLGEITSKGLCFQNEIDAKKTSLSDESLFSLHQHIAFLSHAASLFYSRTATAFKIANICFNFTLSSDNEQPIEEVHHIFSTEYNTRLSSGTLLLSTFDYAQYSEIIDKKSNILKFDEFIDHLPKNILDLCLEIPVEQRHINAKFLLKEAEYKSFSENTGFMKKIQRLPDSLQKSKNSEKNQLWLDAQLATLEAGLEHFYPLKAFLETQKLTKNDLIIELEPEVPACLQAMIKLFLHRYALQYKYNDYTVKIVFLENKDADIVTIEEPRTWTIKLRKQFLNNMLNREGDFLSAIKGYFSLLSDFLVALAQLVRRDELFEYQNLGVNDLIAAETQRIWYGEQLFLLRDKDAAEIKFVDLLLFPINETNELQGMLTLRRLDIMKHHDLFYDKKDEEIVFSDKDITPILKKHGFKKQEKKIFREITNFYTKHRKDAEYKFPLETSSFGKKLISYPRNVD